MLRIDKNYLERCGIHRIESVEPAAGVPLLVVHIYFRLVRTKMCTQSRGEQVNSSAAVVKSLYFNVQDAIDHLPIPRMNSLLLFVIRIPKIIRDRLGFNAGKQARQTTHPPVAFAYRYWEFI